MLPIHGECAPGWEGIREAFAANFAEHGDVGAACCVYRGGRPVVDVWAGFADLAAGAWWERETIQLVFSATKGVCAAVLLRLAERGVVDLDQPVARYWPAFAANGKGDITLRWVLAHRAGLAAVDGDLTLDEVLAWDPVVEAIAAQAPNWPPGTAHGYHARSFGWILGEVVRRVTGRSFGRVVAEEIAGPLGIDLFVGLPAHALGRTARILPPADGAPRVADLLGADSLTARVLSGPSGLFEYGEMWNDPGLLAAEMPSSNGVANARALARFYAALLGPVDGVRLLAPETLAEACRVQSDGPDRVLLLPSTFGTGFMLQPMIVPGGGPAWFGHAGAGGSLGAADPDSGVAVGYVTTRMRFDATGDPRTRRLMEAVRAAAG